VLKSTPATPVRCVEKRCRTAASCSCLPIHSFYPIRIRVWPDVLPSTSSFCTSFLRDLFGRGKHARRRPTPMQRADRSAGRRCCGAHPLGAPLKSRGATSAGSVTSALCAPSATSADESVEDVALDRVTALTALVTPLRWFLRGVGLGLLLGTSLHRRRSCLRVSHFHGPRRRG
jgi:hypothetical protein